MFFVAIILTVIYGITFWLCERHVNEDLDAGYKGICEALWLGIVTMITLGYGDKSPKSICGKILTVLCIIYGVIQLSLLTEILISAITNSDVLSIKDKQVVVKNMTMEQN